MIKVRDEKLKILGIRKYIAVILVAGLFTFCGQLFGQDSLTRGHQLLLEKGLQIQSWTAARYITGGFKLDRWEELGFTTIQLGSAYESMLTSQIGDKIYEGFPRQPDALPFSYVVTDPAKALVSDEYLPKLVSIQYGDEQNINDSSAYADMATQVQALREKYPSAVVYLNQSVGSSGFSVSNFTLSTLMNYTQTVQPDMLHFTEYPFRWDGTGYIHDYEGGSPTTMYVHMEMYRKAGLAGLDGTGSQPIPVGMYVQTFVDTDLNNKVPSESELRLQQFAAWAFGMKEVDAFIYSTIESAGLPGIFFEGTGQTPTESFYQYAELNRQSKNLGDTLVRLISSDVRMVMGEHGSGVTNDLPDGVTAWDSAADEYLESVSAVNLGDKNNGLAGDVIIGLFNPLDASLFDSGSEDDVYFMIVNGLTDSDGDAEDCMQEIHLEFDFADSGIDQLLRISRDTGEIEIVDLCLEESGLYSLDLVLEGGTGDLFRYATADVMEMMATQVPEPLSLIMLSTALGLLANKKRRK